MSETDAIGEMAAELNSEALGIIRQTANEMLGGNCTFVDDDMKLACHLAQRAVLAGLHGDIKSEGLRQNLERAAEAHRARHEEALGRPIQRAFA
jgi:hypothetical protein